MTARKNWRGTSGSTVIAVLAGLIVAASAACGGGGYGGGSSGSNSQSNFPTDPSTGSNGTNANRTSSISVVNSAYSPNATTVTHGTTVKWTWNACDAGYGGEVCTAHTVTFDDGPSSELQDNGTYSRTFDKAGTYKYHCQVHGASMSGTVTVE